jgi:hypothetical protein
MTADDERKRVGYRSAVIDRSYNRANPFPNKPLLAAGYLISVQIS